MGLFGSIAGVLTAGRAASAIGNANIAAEHGVLGATGDAQNAINKTLGESGSAINQAGANINTATGQANNTLQGYLNGQQSNLASSIASGKQGNEGLQAYAASNPQFNFNLQDYINSPAMKFQMEQGTNAITNNASASGLGASGNTSKALEQYGQGLASTYYNQAFGQAQSQFQTNQNATLSNLQALINSGAVGNQQSLQAGATFGVPQANNTINAANSNAGLQQYLAGLNLQGQTTAGNQGIEGSTIAGNFATNAGNARAAGITGTAAAVGGIGDSLASLLMPNGIPGLKAGGGGWLPGSGTTSNPGGG